MNQPYFPMLDSLRGLAALGVFVLHVGYVGIGNRVSVEAYLVQHVSNYPAPSVVVFFALSGFVLYRPFALRRYRQAPRGRLGEYALRRLVRIVPAYWVALIITALVFGNGYVFSGSGVARFFGFTQIYTAHTFNMGVPPAWSLDVDVAFYAALPLIALAIRALPARSRREFLLTEFGMLAVLYVASTAWQAWAATQLAGNSSFFSAELALPGSLDLMVCGMALATLSVAFADVPDGRIRRWIGRFPWALLLLAAVAYVLTGQTPRILPGNHFALVWLVTKQLRCLLALAVLVPFIFGLSGRGWLRAALSHPLALYLGAISYAFYLWHWAVINELLKVGALHALGTPLFVAAALAASLALASASWYGLERPLQRRLRRKLARRRPLQEPTSGPVEASDTQALAVPQA